MGNNYSILVVEDENSISNFMSTILAANEYAVIKAYDGAEAFMMITSHCPDLIILDLKLPDMDGEQIIKFVREWSLVPIIVVSAKTREKDKVEALDLGADDYITKPFGTAELLARVRTALRHVRTREMNASLIQTGLFMSGNLTIDFDKRHVYVNGKDSCLTQKEYKIVALLAKFAGRVLTYDYIIKNIWGPNANCDNQILRVNMANIRRKLEMNPAEPQYIYTEIGVGYRLAEND